MAQIDVNGLSLGSALTDILLSDEITPGDDPSYQLCKTIYLYHPLGAKMVDSPVKKAMSKPRDIEVPGHPEAVVEQFQRQWAADNANDTIAQFAATARIYGVGALALGVVGEDTNKPLKLETLWKEEVYFNVVDPLNTAGTIVLSQDPNSPDFQKHRTIGVAGQAYHRSRTCVLMNERPVYIAWTSSAFGYVGRSVYQRPLYPLKTFVQTMITDQAVTEKAALLIAKMQQPGSISDRLMAGAQALKRALLRGSKTGNVLSINAGTNSTNAEDITTLNMMNVDGAAGFARTNVLKNIATAADMPAVFLENETLTEGFGEGTEDAKQIADYIDVIRGWLKPAYDFMDPLIMRRAWNPEWYKALQGEFPDVYRAMPYETAFYQFKNKFTATWPELLREPASDAVKTEQVKLEGIVAVLEVLLTRCDPENVATALEWAAANLNENKIMFPTPLLLDWQAIAEYEPPQQGMEELESATKPPRPKADSLGGPVRLLSRSPR